MNNSLFMTLKGSSINTGRPVGTMKPRTATTNLLVVMVLACLLVAGCNSKNTNDGKKSTGTTDPSTTQSDSSNQSNTPTSDDNGHMGQRSNGGGMMGEGHDTTRNGTHKKGMNGRPRHRGMMNR